MQHFTHVRYLTFLTLIFCCCQLSAQNILYTEDFNDCELPSDWAVNLLGTGPSNYFLTDAPDDINTNSDGSTIDGSCLVFIDDDIVGQDVDALTIQFVSPPFDATVNSTIRLNVDVHFRSVSGTAFRIKIFDGNEFVEILELNDGSGTGEQLSEFFTFSADLSFYANPNMQVMFEYDDNDGEWGWWAAFDNIEIVGTGEETNLVLQDFNDCEMPSDWIANIITGENNWQFGVNENAYPTSMNGTCFAYFDDDGIGEDAPFSTAMLISPPFDGTQFANFYVDFDVILRRYGDLENLTVGVFDGTNFKPVISYLTDLGGPQFDQTIVERIDISAFRSPEMRVVFVYDDGDVWGWWVGIDNVKISGEGEINDLCENAFDLNLNEPCLAGNNLTALFTGNPSPCALQNVGSLWYRYEATTTGLVEIKTNATFNDVVTVFNGNCATLNEALCDNWDEYGFVGETTEFQATAGTTYFIRVNGADDAFGITRGDVCMQLMEIPTLPTIPTNNACTNATPISLDENCVLGTNIHATLNGNPPTLNEKSRADIWYSFTATTNNPIEILSNANFSDVMAVYSGVCGNLEEIAANDYGQKLVLENLTIDNTYFLQITGNFATVEGNVCVEMHEQQITPPANDDCAAAMTLILDAACLSVTNVGANYSGQKPSCEVYPSADVWFEFTAPASGTIQLNTGAAFVHTLAIYSGSCGDLEEINCTQNPIACDGFFTVGSLTPNETYLLQIATANDVFENGGQGELCISILDGNALAPTSMTISANVNCVAEGSGQLTFAAVGGVPPYTFQGNNNGETMQTGEEYLIIVTDATSCQKSLTGTISCGVSDCTMSLLANATNATCNAANNGTATIATENSNGTPTFLWSNGATEATLTNLEPGGYTVTVTDGIGCESTTVITISEPALLIPYADATDETTFDSNDGTVTAQPTGGTQPYTYNWSNGSTSQTQTGLAPGAYAVTIIDANQCETEEMVEIQAFDCALNANISTENVTCNNANNGTATISIQGGTTPYIYNWSNGQNGQTIENLAPGTYSVTASDANDCPTTMSITITEPTILIANANAMGETANDANDGTATANPQGGTPPYNFSWSNGGNEQTISNLAPGNYVVTITDENDCQTTETISVNAFDCALQVQVSQVENASCNAGNDGMISVTAMNGNGNLTYVLANGTTSTNGIFTDLPAANYAITVNDDAGCSFVVNATVSQPSVLQSSIMNQTNTDCAANEIGTATVTASGGTSPYIFNWSNGETGATQTNLAADTYVVEVVDANDCTTEIAVTIQVNDNQNPIVSAQNITVELDANGNANISENDINNGSSDNCEIENIALNVTTFNCNNLGENQVQLTVTDVNGNVNSAPATVTVVDNIDPVFTCPADILSPDCSGLIVYDLAEPTDNCTVSDPVLINGFASGEIFPNGETTVTYVVTDFAGNTTTCSFLVTVENPLQSEILVEKPSCFGLEDGEATIMVTGGTGDLTYQWSNDETTETIENLAVGTYDVTVTDAVGCEIIATAVVPEPPNVIFTVENIVNESQTGSLDGDIDIAIEGGTPPFSYEWYVNEMLFATGLDIENIPGGDYQLFVYDDNGCIYTSEIITIETLVGVEDLSPLAGVVQLFPNPTSGKIFINMQLEKQSAVEITVYDIAGRKLMETEDAAVLVRDFSFDLTGFASGVYQVKILVGEEVLVEKVVVE